MYCCFNILINNIGHVELIKKKIRKLCATNFCRPLKSRRSKRLYTECFKKEGARTKDKNLSIDDIFGLLEV